MPATSQLDWLSSTTVMIVLFWSRATRDLLGSFGITALIVAAWAVLVIYTAVVILFAGFAITAQDRVESAFMIGYAAVLALPLSIMFPVLYIGTRRRNRVGPWICIVLGAVSLCLLILLLTS